MQIILSTKIFNLEKISLKFKTNSIGKQIKSMSKEKKLQLILSGKKG